MDALKTITRRVEDGFVLNEQGRWIYMAEQRIYERRVIDELVNGNVLVDGKWVAIGEALKRGRSAAPKTPISKPAAQPAIQAPPAHIATPVPPPIAPVPRPAARPAALAHAAPFTPLTPPQADAASFEAMGDMLETVCIDMTAPAMIKAMDAAKTKPPVPVNHRGLAK